MDRVGAHERAGDELQRALGSTKARWVCPQRATVPHEASVRIDDVGDLGEYLAPTGGAGGSAWQIWAPWLIGGGHVAEPY